jgi:hypothetical protein
VTEWKVPGDYEGADDAPEPDAAITRWTTVVLHPDELGWLREALALNAADDEPVSCDSRSSSNWARPGMRNLEWQTRPLVRLLPPEHPKDFANRSCLFVREWLGPRVAAARGRWPP